ncbi:hypothetical protein J1605_013879 [Eschrichtius robustus]|uniref:Uncharacterized protein n=1 Tax=Eschrichtius robustus TaxID=9764 RepID=A0AB34GGD9_ESCRO|nr:hypothetical protein J1605_013879 [Eschrichtius robustus]
MGAEVSRDHFCSLEALNTTPAAELPSRPKAARGQGCALRGWRSEDWGIHLSVQPGQLQGQVWPRNLLCRRSAQLERKSLSVSAPSSPSFRPHIPAPGAKSAAEAAGGQEGERAGSGALTLLGGGACERRACAQREAVAPAKTKGKTVAERARGG